MVIDVFKIIGVLGVILISIGVITKKRKRQDTFYILGGGVLKFIVFILVI